MAQSDTQQETSPPTAGSVDDASRPFVGKWHTLISTTNWEKGRIISEWRSAKQQAGEEVSEYSDEAWAALVGEVTSQHVGRLRRVYDQYGQSYTEYEGLFWSHFHAALDWDDAEIWLEGALQQGWSISQMRKMRDKAHGKADDTAESNVTASRVPKEGEQASTAELAEVADPNDEEHPETDSTESSASATDGDSDTMPAAGKTTTAKHRPFESLAELPDDLADAFEAMKLSILAHKLTNWQDISRDDVLASLEALKVLATAPSE